MDQTNFLNALFRKYIEQRIEKYDVNSDALARTTKRIVAAHKALLLLRELAASPEQEAQRLWDKEFGDLLAELEALLQDYQALLQDSGIFDVLDRYRDQMVEAADPKTLPAFEAEVLARLGSADPNQELHEGINAFKDASQEIKDGHYESIAQRMELLRADIPILRSEIDTSAETKSQTQDKKRWALLEASGKLLRGIGITTVDVSVAVNLWPLVGGGWIIISAISGTGLIIEGFAKIKNSGN